MRVATLQVPADSVILKGVFVTCVGTGYIPLDVQIELQEEHLGVFYGGRQSFDETSRWIRVRSCRGCLQS